MRPISTPTSASSLGLVLAVLFLATTALAQPPGDDSPHLGSLATSEMKAFRGIIEDRCIVCHERPMVVEAVQTEKFDAMQQHLLEQGVPLSEDEKRVLGTFWGDPMRQKARPAAEGPSISKADYHHFRQVLQSRCTDCHTLERVERAMTRQQSYEDVIEQMLKRGAVLSERETGILRKFWGQEGTGRR